MTSANPSRGEIWMADLDPTRGHEQAGQRPVLVVSEDLFNRGPAGLLIFGETQSTDFPADHRFGTSGNTDLYVTKMKSDGTTVLWSLLIGGSWEEMTGKTGTTDFPVTPGAYDTTPNGGDAVLFGMKFASTPLPPRRG